jgi:hypothetical protein
VGELKLSVWVEDTVCSKSDIWSHHKYGKLVYKAVYKARDVTR